MSTILKTLADTTYDSVEGYRKAAEKADSPRLKQALSDRCARRQQTLDLLNAEMGRRGDDLVTKGTMTGELHQLWMSITDMFESGDEAAAERVEEGEDYIAKKFRAALEDKDLEPELRGVIETAYAEIAEAENFADMLEQQYD